MCIYILHGQVGKKCMQIGNPFEGVAHKMHASNMYKTLSLSPHIFLVNCTTLHTTTIHHQPNSALTPSQSRRVDLGTARDADRTARTPPFAVRRACRTRSTSTHTATATRHAREGATHDTTHLIYKLRIKFAFRRAPDLCTWSVKLSVWNTSFT